MRVTADDRSGDGEPWFRHVRRVPSGPVREVVRESWTVQAARCRTAVERALPDASVEIYINLERAGRHLHAPGANHDLAPRAAWVLGPHAKPLFIEKEVADCDIIGIRLQPGLASRALGVPAAELRDRLVDLDALWGPAVESLRDRLQSTRELADRLSLVETTIANRVTPGALAQDSRRVRALLALMDRVPRITIAEVAGAHGMSHRSVITLLEQGIGLTPKLMQRVQRVRRVLREIHAPTAGRMSWACIALRCGYFDQAHLINDFRALTGLTPAEYDAKRSSVGRGFAQFIAARDR